jgi:hypothetical protein
MSSRVLCTMPDHSRTRWSLGTTISGGISGSGTLTPHKRPAERCEAAAPGPPLKTAAKSFW